MNSELFPIASVTKLSPRLEWIAKNEIHTKQVGAGEDEFNDWKEWLCWSEGPLDGDERISPQYEGDTEDDCLVAWAKANKVRLWNEEGIK